MGQPLSPAVILLSAVSLSAYLLAGCIGSGDPPVLSPVSCEPLRLEEVSVWHGHGDLPQLESTRRMVGIAIGDLDGDGWLDAVAAFKGGGVGLRNDGSGTLIVDSTIQVDGGPIPASHAIALADLDGDGDLDGHLGRSEAVDLLLWNDGTGAFTSTSLEGSEGMTYSGAFADADGDGDLDLYVSAGQWQLDPEGVVAGTVVGDPNLFYRNVDGVYLLDLEAIPAETGIGLTFEGEWFDVEGDGDLDIYVANDGGPFLDPNHLLLNDGTGHFTDAVDCSCQLEMLAMGVATGDVNRDGLPDLYITDVGGPNLLLNGGDRTFHDGTLATGTEIPAAPDAMTSWGTHFVDLDQDACEDLVVLFGRSGAAENLMPILFPGQEDGDEQPDVVLRNLCDGTFDRLDFESSGFGSPGRSRSVAVGDLDRDGRPDVVVAGKPYLRVYRNVGGCEPGVTLVLEPPGGPPHGIGARVEVTVGDHVNVLWMLPASASSSSAPELYLGLRGEPVADSVVVAWPDGSVSEERDVRRGTVLVLP